MTAAEVPVLRQALERAAVLGLSPYRLRLLEPLLELAGVGGLRGTVADVQEALAAEHEITISERRLRDALHCFNRYGLLRWLVKTGRGAVSTLCRVPLASRVKEHAKGVRLFASRRTALIGGRAKTLRKTSSTGPAARGPTRPPDDLVSEWLLEENRLRQLRTLGADDKIEPTIRSVVGHYGVDLRDTDVCDRLDRALRYLLWLEHDRDERNPPKRNPVGWWIGKLKSLATVAA
jgi:hypothetical protein